MPSLKKALMTLTSAIALGGMVAAPALADQNQWRGNGVRNVYNNGYNTGFRNNVNRSVIVNRSNRGGRVIVNNFNRGNVGFVGANRFNNRRVVNNARFNNFRRGNGLNGAEAAVIGVGAGLLSLALINQSRQNNRPQTVIVQNTQPVNVVPQGTFNQTIAGNQVASNQFSQCLQVREYQTTVIVGGQPQNAYGNACLQQDGSWLQGPATAVPY